MKTPWIALITMLLLFAIIFLGAYLTWYSYLEAAIIAVSTTFGGYFIDRFFNKKVN